MTATLWLARHGETEWSAAHKHTGSTDIALTPQGERQAQELGNGIRHLGIQFKQVVASPLQRARQTAQLAGFPNPKIMSELKEWDYGIYEGRRTDEIRQHEGANWLIWNAEKIERGESLQSVGQRADRAISALVSGHHGNVLVFSHGHFLRIMAARWVGQSPSFGQRLALDTGTVCLLGYEHEYRVIRYWNAHLEAETGHEN